MATLGYTRPREESEERDDRDDRRKPYPEPELDELAGPEGGRVGRRLAAFWMQQVIQCDDDKEFKRWLKRGTTIEKRYRDDRNRVDEDQQRRYNALWANVEILTPALYGKQPVPTCERRFRDKDPVGRGAAQILERGLRNEIEVCGFDEAMRQALRDYLLVGRGTVWVRYEPQFGESISIPTDDEQDQSDTQGDIEDEDNSDEEVKLRETSDRITRESTPVDFIQWTDFYTFPNRARTWKEVTAVGKRVYMTREQMKRRFGKDIGRNIPFQKDDRKTRRQEDTTQGHEVDEKAQIFEIWDRTHEEVIWVAEGYQYLCDRKDDPLKLENFFPCPKPLYSNVTNNTLVPVPDFIQYQDQAIQIDELTQRIAMLAKACKVAGVYNAAAKGIQRLFNESVENEMIPVDDWAAFAEKGGVAGNLSFIPLKEIMGVIEELTQIKERAVVEMDRLTGISDIMRGTTDARETLGGQRLKSNASGTRLQARQNEVARLARDTLRIMADIMCQHFSSQSLIEVSGALYEQGLGTMDVPMEDMLQKGVPPQSPGPPGAPPALPGGPSSPGGPPLPPPPGMGAPGPAMGAGGAPGMPGMPGPKPPGGPMGGPPSPGGAPQGMPPPGMPGPPPMPGAPGQLPVPQPPRPGMGFQGPMPPPQPQLSPQMLDKLKGMERIVKALQLIRNEKLLGFRVEIEVESTIYADQQQERGDRTAFVAAVTQYLTQAAQITANVPQIAPLLGKLLQFSIRGYNVGRDLEQAIEDFTDEAGQLAMQHQQSMASQPNPMVMKAQADMMKAKADMQSSQMKMQTDQQQTQAEIHRQQIESQAEQYNSQTDLQQKQIDLEMRKLEMQIELTRLQIEKAKAENELKAQGLKSHNETVKAQTDQQRAMMDQEDHAFDRAMDYHGKALDQQQQFMQGAQEHHKMNMEAAQTERERQLQEQQHAHERQQVQMDHKLQQQQHQHNQQEAQQQHKLAQIKLQQQRAAARRPKATH